MNSRWVLLYTASQSLSMLLPLLASVKMLEINIGDIADIA
jgi:hypothetical protein